MPVAPALVFGGSATREFATSTAALGPACQYARANRVNNAHNPRSVAITGAFVDAPEAGAYRPGLERVAPRAAALDNSGFTAMAPRRAAKARSKSAPAAARPARGKAPSGKQAAAAANGSLRDRLAAVEGERDALKEELERFKARQRRLEETQAQVRDRISWALDSLHNILDGKG